MSLRLIAFSCGWFQCKNSFFVEGWDDQTYVRSPVPSYLIDHPKGRAVFDTGLGLRYRREIDKRLPPNKFGLDLYEDHDVAARLRAIDIDPASIDWIITSHLHIDHCGGNMFLPNATVIVQSRELAAARTSDDAMLYNPEDFETGQPITAIDGEHDLFGDGSVTLFPTFGHTPGHQSVRVKLPSGEVILAGDCCYIKRNLDELRLPANTWDKQIGVETLRALAKARARGTRVFYGHDAQFWSTITEGQEIA